MYDTVKNKIYLLFLIKKYTFIYLSMFLIIFILDVSTKVMGYIIHCLIAYFWFKITQLPR